MTVFLPLNDILDVFFLNRSLLQSGDFYHVK